MKIERMQEILANGGAISPEISSELPQQILMKRAQIGHFVKPLVIGCKDLAPRIVGIIASRSSAIVSVEWLLIKNPLSR